MVLVHSVFLWCQDLDVLVSVFYSALDVNLCAAFRTPSPPPSTCRCEAGCETQKSTQLKGDGGDHVTTHARTHTLPPFPPPAPSTHYHFYCIMFFVFRQFRFCQKHALSGAHGGGVCLQNCVTRAFPYLI